MHLIAIRRSLYEQHRWLATSFYKAFVEAKRRARARMRYGGSLATMLPWLLAEIEEIDAVFGGDAFPYGVEPNRPTLEALVRYMVEQHFIPGRFPSRSCSCRSRAASAADCDLVRRNARAAIRRLPASWFTILYADRTLFRIFPRKAVRLAKPAAKPGIRDSARASKTVIWASQVTKEWFHVVVRPQHPITLDFTTLFVVAICVTGLLGLLLLFAWTQDRVRALAWWGTAYLVGGVLGRRSGASRATSRRRCRPAPPMRCCSSPAA